MSPLPAALPPFDVPAPAAAHAAVSTGPAALASTLATERTWTSYTVRPGDTLYDIAEARGTTVQALVARNSLAQGGRWLTPGQRLSVPGKASSSSDTSSQSSTTTSRSKGATVTVRPGDTLSHIALQHGVSVRDIMKANSVTNPRLIFPGQKLTIPGTESSSSSRSKDTSSSRSSSSGSSKSSTSKSSTSKSSSKSTSKGATVTVRPGDTLSHIAARHGISLSALQSANPGLDPRRLWVGQKVVVPAGSSSSSSSGTVTRPWTPATIGDTKKGEKVQDTFLHYTYSSAVARSAAANREYLAEVPVPSRAETKKLITDTARRHGVDPKLMLALAYQESGWNQRAVSPANAIGIMQVIPTSGEWASMLIGRDLNLLDPQDNVTAGVVIMRALLRSASTEQKAIGGYYQGLASVNRHGLFSDTKHYVASIRALRDRM
ncbi:LysM peptidoglycan-binding domain-containing protein [Ornithinimicrobium sediminis]|uniref:LysM peptidoglycan-binding domain-containing protein n=1 Tax=Ornithinimicrobium sediminis TaxID=2904603 RepID=UPI001E4157A4|nr:LysM peptidoglycan-binding domain-containing protein [Ornithinimicrobium sediminis]MCE0488013.1 LysM peptidoglycan-binding domain-containing protein [Ornithinimicrobium sediminis]